MTVQLKEHSLAWYSRSFDRIIAHIRLRLAFAFFFSSVLHCIDTEFWLSIFVYKVPWMALLQFIAISICLFYCDWCYMLTAFATSLIVPHQLELNIDHISCDSTNVFPVSWKNMIFFCDFYLSTYLIPVKSCYSLAILLLQELLMINHVENYLEVWVDCSKSLFLMHALAFSRNSIRSLMSLMCLTKNTFSDSQCIVSILWILFLIIVSNNFTGKGIRDNGQ